MNPPELPIIPSLDPTTASMAPLSVRPESAQRLHRISEVRRSQNVSLASIAQQLGIPVATAREQEQPESDMLLSQLHLWQKFLGVPVAELLIDLDDYPDNPIRRRGQLVKVMKTVRTILERAQEAPIKLLAQTLSDQLIEMMPELEHVHSWPSVGQSREAKDLGQAAYRRFDANVSRIFDQND